MSETKARVLLGVVVQSKKAANTITVRVDRKIQHPLYKKIITRSTKLLVHDQEEISNIGDKVEIVESKPISKRKFWKLLNIIEKAS